MAMRLSALCTGRALPPGEILCTHLYQTFSQPQSRGVAREIRLTEKMQDLYLGSNPQPFGL
jgi:hypothetical protein